MCRNILGMIQEPFKKKKGKKKPLEKRQLGDGKEKYLKGDITVVRIMRESSQLCRTGRYLRNKNNMTRHLTEVNAIPTHLSLGHEVYYKWAGRYPSFGPPYSLFFFSPIPRHVHDMYLSFLLYASISFDASPPVEAVQDGGDQVGKQTRCHFCQMSPASPASLPS